MKISRRISFVFILSLFFVVIIASTDPTDPRTWTPNELKEWLAEHRIVYRGIPEKQELIGLVKANWQDLKGRANTTNEAVESFVTKYVDMIKDNYYGTKEENYDEFVQDIANQVESIRQATGLTEEQIQSTIDEVVKTLKEKKVEGSKNLTNALNEIKRSYSMAKAKRDVLIQKTANQAQDDLIKSGEVSQKTLDWFRDEINKMNEERAFAKVRTETQVSLVLEGFQEQLTKRKVATEDQINASFKSLSSVAEQYYQTISGTLERIRHDLAQKIGGTSGYIVDELKSQLSTVNDYRLLTQEKIQSSIDAIGQKLSDGKTLTVEQLNLIRSSINKYFSAIRDYYNSATGQAQQTVLETKKSQEERLNQIIEYVRSSINDARNKGNEKVSIIIQNVEDSVVSTQQLTAEQTKILKETIQEKFGNVKSSRDITEEKVNSFTEALRTRMAAARDYASDVYDTTTQKVEEGYNVAYNKVSSGAESVGEGFEKVKEKLTPSHDKHDKHEEL
jgi:hypothetical protein